MLLKTFYLVVPAFYQPNSIILAFKLPCLMEIKVARIDHFNIMVMSHFIFVEKNC